MTESENQENERRKLAMANLLWMQYFNQSAFERGVITEQERNRMKVKINLRFGPETAGSEFPNLYSSHQKCRVVE